MFVSRDGSLLYTGHHGKVNIWKCNRVSTHSKATWTLEKTVYTPVKGDVTSMCEVFDDNNLLAIAVDNSIVFYNQRNLNEPVQQVSFNKQEVNQLDVHFKGTSICACDDSGEIKVIDLKSFQVLKTLRGHDNICATVKFVTRKPWELISGGLDCKLIRWDFNRGRPLTVLNQVDLISNSDDKSLSMGSGSYSINPPMIHSIDMFPSTSTVICGLGNGMIAAYGLRSGKEMDLLCMETFHSSSIACVCCIEVPKKEAKLIDQFVISGGNDGKICVVEFRKEEPSTEKFPAKPSLRSIFQLTLATHWNNSSKINWISVQSPSVIEATEHQVLRVFVADQTSSVSVYDCSMLSA